jgi:hypothetical protein
MDGDLMKLLHGNLHLLSQKSFERLKTHYAGNTLTSQEQNLLRNEITAAKDMLRVHPLLD